MSINTSRSESHRSTEKKTPASPVMRADTPMTDLRRKAIDHAGVTGAPDGP
ncbi:MAG: hypothetical protein HOK41_02910 [Nitrospina sp.]|nr:hypothetical protein [Nitrospina sp.]